MGETIETEVMEIDEDYALVRIGGENGTELEFGYDWDLHEPVFEASFGEEARSVAVQHLKHVANGYRLQHIGSEIEIQVWNEAENAVRSHIRPSKRRICPSSSFRRCRER